MEYDITDIAPRPNRSPEWWEKCEMTISTKHLWDTNDRVRKCKYCGLIDDLGVTR